MNVRLETKFYFTAGSYIDNQLRMTRYCVSLQLITQSYSGVEQNVALDRVKYMLYNQFSNCIFISEDDKQSIEKLVTAELPVVELPDVAVDQIIGIMLYCKLNAVMEERILITELKISSELGQHMIYCHHEEEDIGPFDTEGWWHDSLPNVVDKKQQDRKIVQLVKSSPWHDLNLDWDDSDDSTVVTLDNYE